MKKHLIIVVAALTIWGCNSEKKLENAAYQASEPVKDMEVKADSTLIAKIIKTADMRFRVKNVLNTKQELSKTIKYIGGTVVETSVESFVEKTEKVKYSADSLLEITAYSTQGVMVAKVPSEQLDDFLNQVSKMAVFVNTQSMKLDDQSIAYLANKLKAQNRTEALNSLNKQAVKKSGNVESSLFIKDDFVDKKVENMLIDDKVKFSTLTLNFYQDNTINRQVVANDNLADYRPGFFTRLGLNLVNGWVVFKEFILVLSNLWMLFLLMAASVIGFKYYRKRKKMF